MRDLKDEPRRFVVFVDCLGHDDVENHTDFIQQRAYDGQMDAGNPYVTPKVLGEIYTGENPAVHGLPAVSRYDQDPRGRPAAPTLPEIVAEDDTYENVCNFGLPFILNVAVNNPNGVYWHSSSAMGQRSMGPADAHDHLTVSGPAGDMSDLDVDDNIIFSLRQDHITQTFAQARSIAHAQDFDVMFISIRTLDEYCHHRYQTMDASAQKTDRQLLTEIVDREIELLSAHGDVFVFGDHGATDLDHVFKINRWLCYDPETEVLTDDGWKSVADVDESDRVMTLNPDTHEAELQTPTETFEYDFEGQMFRHESQQADLLVTPNHRLYQKPRAPGKDPDWRLVPAFESAGRSKHFKKNAEWTGDGKGRFEITTPDGEIATFFEPEPWLKFTGLWTTDGTVDVKENATGGESGTVRIYQDPDANPGVWREVIEVIEDLGYEPRIQEDHGYVQFHDLTVARYLDQFNSPKRLPDNIRTVKGRANAISTEQAQLLLDYMVMGDGHVRESGHTCITTTSEPLRDGIQTLALMAGTSANAHHQVREGPVDVNGSVCDDPKDIFTVSILQPNRNEPQITQRSRDSDSFSERLVDYDGAVHCVSVPNHIMYVRRGGKPLWCGNSDNGYLEVEIDEEFREQAVERGVMEEPDAEGKITNVGMPHVDVIEEESVAISDDPFSGGLTLLDGATEEAVEWLIEDLEETPYVDEVEWTADKWEGDLLDEAPDLYPRRAVGTFISGNLAEEKGGAEVTRSGVHHPTAAWGATTDLETSGEITPTELHDVILNEFLGIEDPDRVTETEYEVSETDEEAAREHLRDLGYM